MPDPRALIQTNLRLEAAPGIPDIQLYRAHPGSGMGRFVGGDTAPYWAHLWAGGAALAMHVLARPDSVRGRRVLDLGCGSGVVGVAAAKAGAASVLAADVDRFAIAATQLNAQANGVHVSTFAGDLLDGAAPDCDLILIGDLFYDEALAMRVIAALDRWKIETLVGDMGRKALPRGRLKALVSYEVSDFGSSAPVAAQVFRFGCASSMSHPRA